ncbi:Peptide/nitrate transporter [Lasiodiplodia theobromae]|nr:Peptide/nitrate transporter [Lasiodiplodia theobromae]KAB2573391.1 putative membrane protein [Lasiodiplodia theobromae]KAF4546141.1 Peptide/nitrate transporter [Lasiodiplodia theobromae]
MLLPFVYFMVKDFGYPEAKIGPRAGIITSCFFVAQMFSTPFWSVWSNSAGRKPTLLAGLFSAALGTILFGLSQSLAWAIVARCLCGLLNGNFPVARTMVGELAELSGTDKGKAFSLFGFCLAAGWLIGPMIGGTLARPAIQLGISGPAGLFVRFPYLLPCICAASINLIVFAASWFLLDDTKPAPRRGGDTGPDEADPLLGPADPPPPKCRTTNQRNRRVQVMCLASSLFFFTHAILFDELFPLFAVSSTKAGTGLSFLPRDIATALMASGPAMFVALLGFPLVHKRVSAPKLYALSALVFVVVYPAFSLLPSVGAAWLWPCLVTLIMLRYMSLVVSLTSLNIMINDIVVPEERALINGVAQSIGSFARTIGPTLGGCVWSWSLSSGLPAPLDFHACFVLLATLGAAQGATALMLFRGSDNVSKVSGEGRVEVAED